MKNCKLKEIKISKASILEVLGLALKKVKDDYIKISYQHVVRNLQKPERVFVAELYHQLRCIQESGKYASLLGELKFNVEINKQGRLGDLDEFILNYNISKVIPDLVLHHSQNNNDHEKQLLACEVKSSYYITQRNFEKDLVKLLLYKSSRFNYQNACFIFMGTKEELCKYLMQLSPDFFIKLERNKIIFITYENEKTWSFYTLQ